MFGRNMRICTKVRGWPVAGLLFALTSSCGDNLAPELEVTGLVYEDTNGNGVIDPGEGIANWAVFLRSDDGQTITVQTNSQGEFVFEDVKSGEYVLEQEMQFGYRSDDQKTLRSVGQDNKITGGTPLRRHIIGGAESTEAAYPFMVSVGALDGGFYHFCGGVLVNDQFVVTAAHCSEGESPQEVGVMLGTNNPDIPGHVSAVSQIIVHPNWNGSTSDGFDIALWRLASPLDLQALGLFTVASLEEEDAVLASPQVLASTLGWGVSDLEGVVRLQEVHLPIVTNESCSESYAGVVFDTQICAGIPEGGLDSCQGDSGGPLLVRDQEQKRWVHAGITSWGRGCAEAGLPGIYGRVSALSAWAKQEMKEQSKRAYVVTLTSRDQRADFVNVRTTREMFGEIDERWGMAALVTDGLRGGELQQFEGFSLEFRLLEDELSRVSEFICSLDRDGEGPLAAVSFACQAGINRVAIEGYDALGVVSLRISVEAGGRAKTRQLDLRVVQ